MFWRRRKRLDEEIDHHLAGEIADNIDRGMDPRSAREAALRTFGNVGAAKERAREVDPLYWLDILFQDIRFAFRIIGRNRWTSATIVATLTAGIAINVSVFSLLNAMLLRPWVRHQPETFVSLIPRFSGRYDLRFSDYASMSQPDYVRFRESARSLESLAAYQLVTLTIGGEEAGSIRGGLVSCNLFDVVAAGRPVLGRYLAPDECGRPGETAAAVLSESAWRMRFGGDRNIVGRVIHLNRIAFVVVGVAPGFSLSISSPDTEVWVPYTMLGTLRTADEYFGNPRAQWLMAIGRRAAGYSIQQVQEELRAIARRSDEGVPGRTTALMVTNGSLAEDPENRTRVPLIFSITLGTTTLLLLLACVNVTTMLLSRSAARQREIAVRLSLGAGRFRLIRQLLTESLVLSGAAALASLLIARRVPGALWYAIVSSPAPFDLSPDWRVLLYSLGVGVAAGIISGLSPALESLRPRLAEALKGSGTAVTAGQRRSRLRSGLVAAQIALSLSILVEAGLLLRAQRRFFSHDPGFETRQVLTITLASVRAGFEPPQAFYRELAEGVKRAPGVVRTSFVTPAPWSGRSSTELSALDGRPFPPTGDFRRDPASRRVSPEYFAVLRIPLVRGRAFGPGEGSTGSGVTPVVISESMARRYWPGQDAIGHRFQTKIVHEVVGVCRDVQSIAYLQDDGPIYYAPLEESSARPAHLLVRVAGDPQSAARGLREIVRALDPQLASTVISMAAAVEREGRRLSPVLMLGTVAGVLALLLALTGVYAVVSFSVNQRMREIGIRVALGAQRGDVIAMILRGGVLPIAAGLAAGVGLALAASAGMKSVLFGLNPRDPLTFGLMSAVLFFAALGAIWIPARRAARLDPLASIRYE